MKHAALCVEAQSLVEIVDVPGAFTEPYAGSPVEVRPASHRGSLPVAEVRLSLGQRVAPRMAQPLPAWWAETAW
jgi:hypothetical protein